MGEFISTAVGCGDDCRKGNTHRRSCTALINVSALPDARSGWKANRAEGSARVQVKPLAGGRWRLRWTRGLWEFNCGKERCWGAPELCQRGPLTTVRASKLATTKKDRDNRAKGAGRRGL